MTIVSDLTGELDCRIWIVPQDSSSQGTTHASRHCLWKTLYVTQILRHSLFDSSLFSIDIQMGQVPSKSPCTDYYNRPSYVISSMSAVANTSDHLHCELVFILFLQTHRETWRIPTQSKYMKEHEDNTHHDGGIPSGTARALHVQLCSEFTSHYMFSLVLNLVPGIVSGT